MRVEISPPAQPVNLSMRPPGSKSHTIRALFAAALADGVSQLRSGLDAVDTARARACLGLLGASIEKQDTLWSVGGTGGRLKVPEGSLDAGESGLTARFLIAIAPMVPGEVTIGGSGRLPERPMEGIISAVADFAEIKSRVHPWRLIGRGGFPGGRIEVDGSQSSQMVSGLMLAAAVAEHRTELVVKGMESSHTYLDVTRTVMSAFGSGIVETQTGFLVEPTGFHPTTYEVPVDASSAVYPAAAAAVTGGRVTIEGDMADHPDRYFFEVLSDMGCRVSIERGATTVEGPPEIDAVDIDMSRAPDAAITVAVLAAVADGPTRIEGLGSLRHKESDRLAALSESLGAFGSDVAIEDDTLVISPGEPRRVTIASRGDHRLAMAFSILGLRTPGIAIDDGSVVSKTWPGYWEWLETSGAFVRRI